MEFYINEGRIMDIDKSQGNNNFYSNLILLKLFNLIIILNKFLNIKGIFVIDTILVLKNFELL